MAAINNGANILWQVAGMDDRLDGIIPINNTGYDEFNSNLSEDVPLSQLAERNIWSLCCASPSYAKFIKCPVLNVCTIVDRSHKHFAWSNRWRKVFDKTYYLSCDFAPVEKTCVVCTIVAGVKMIFAKNIVAVFQTMWVTSVVLGIAFSCNVKSNHLKARLHDK